MSEVITDGIQPRFKVRRDVDRRVNVSQFESHGGFRARGGQRVDHGPRFNPFSRVGGPCSWSSKRHISILPSSLRKHDQRARARLGSFRSRKRDEHGRPFDACLLVYVSALDYTCIISCIIQRFDRLC